MKFYFFNNCFVLLSLRLIHSVIVVLANYLTIGRHFHNVQFIDIPKLSGLGHCSTSHTGQFMVHTEVVLQGDGRIGLRGSLHLDVLLGFHCLMQAVAPSSTLHNTSRLFVHYLNFTVLDNVLIIEVEHCIGLEQLLKRVNTFAFDGVVVVHLVFFCQPLLVRERHRLDFRHFGSDIGQDEESGILHLVSQPFITFIREIHAVLLFVHDKEQRLHSLRHASVVVLHVNLFRSQHTALDARFGKELNESFVLGQGLMGTEQ